MPNDNERVKPGFKFAAIAASTVLVVALAATGMLAYGQNNNTGSNMTALEEQQVNSTGAASSNATEIAASSKTTANHTSDRVNEATFTASASADSECAPFITTEDGAALNGTTSLIAGTISEDEIETMTAGLNDTQVATLDELIENACDAIRDGKSVTALGFLSTARDILNDASETGMVEAQSGDEPSSVEAADEEGKDES